MDSSSISDDSDFDVWEPTPNHTLLGDKPIFLMLVGIPAQGKSTYAAYLMATLPNAYLLCPDLIRLEVTGNINDQSKNSLIFKSILPARMAGAKSQGKNIVYDACSYSASARYSILEQANQLGYRVEAHVFRVPLEVCIQRNETRQKKVPVEVIHRMYRNWEEPELDEGIDKIVEVPLGWLEKTISHPYFETLIEANYNNLRELAAKKIDNLPQVD